MVIIGIKHRPAYRHATRLKLTGQFNLATMNPR